MERPTPDARPDTARGRRWIESGAIIVPGSTTTVPYLASLLDWIDAHPVRGDGPTDAIVAELRAVPKFEGTYAICRRAADALAAAPPQPDRGGSDLDALPQFQALLDLAAKRRALHPTRWRETDDRLTSALASLAEDVLTRSAKVGDDEMLGRSWTDHIFAVLDRLAASPAPATPNLDDLRAAFDAPPRDRIVAIVSAARKLTEAPATSPEPDEWAGDDDDCHACGGSGGAPGAECYSCGGSGFARPAPEAPATAPDDDVAGECNFRADDGTRCTRWDPCEVHPVPDTFEAPATPARPADPTGDDT